MGDFNAVLDKRVDRFPPRDAAGESRGGPFFGGSRVDRYVESAESDCSAIFLFFKLLFYTLQDRFGPGKWRSATKGKKHSMPAQRGFRPLAFSAVTESGGKKSPGGLENKPLLV